MIGTKYNCMTMNARFSCDSTTELPFAYINDGFCDCKVTACQLTFVHQCGCGKIILFHAIVTRTALMNLELQHALRDGSHAAVVSRFQVEWWMMAFATAVTRQMKCLGGSARLAKSASESTEDDEQEGWNR
jgi:hypothetical protein